ncbi:MAG: hypothetical protein ACREB8_13100 [Pseudolabrys sp.]
MTVLQVAGSLLAIPVGIASGYSVYRANFSPAATCQSLRSNILATLDKGVDASTRRMLVRRDVEAFEKSCGTVDPDAYAAFKTLLAARPTQPPVATIAPTAPPQKEAGPRPALAARQPAAESPSTAVNPDTIWVAAVRRALVTESRDAVPHADAATANIATPPPAMQSPPLDIRAAMDAPANAPMPLASAPALPPATSVAAIPAQAADPGHPVPPASIPELASAPSEPPAQAHTGLRLGAWIARIPLVGRMMGGHTP